MPFEPDKHHRRSVRLREYNYAQEGAYFVTICTYQRACIFGEIVDDENDLSTLGCIVAEEWERTEKVRPYVIVDEFVVMPNHLHGILLFTGHMSSGGLAAANPAFGKPIAKVLATIMANFKSITTKQINKVQGTQGAAVWQRSFYDRVMRSERELNNVRRYIETNPMRWSEDEENPIHLGR